MEINRYNRGLWKFGPLEQCKDGELVFVKDIQPVIDDMAFSLNKAENELLDEKNTFARIAKCNESNLKKIDILRKSMEYHRGLTEKDKDLLYKLRNKNGLLCWCLAATWLIVISLTGNAVGLW
jgi:hypothetical protein